MKVILTKDVRDMGHAHDIVEVADGHAINFLIPKKLAVPATTSAVKVADSRKAKTTALREAENQLIKQNLDTLAESRIVITKKVNEKGHLYDAIGTPEILSAIKEQAHVELPKDTVRLEQPIKEVGTFDVPVVHGDDFGKFSVVVEAQV
ncbi:MAG TPA: 50S ribosomal protein L9 [Candidatus Kaiserbacteria bacterium]|nr:50S ribosomal protein L9 [Candidatus Kaiserbacteria bacterium]